MIVANEFQLTRNCDATLIPEGNAVVLEKDAVVSVTQALGNSITVKTKMGLFRIHKNDLDALGQDAIELYSESNNTETSEPSTPTEYSEEHIWNALKQCFDPEIPINTPSPSK